MIGVYYQPEQNYLMLAWRKEQSFGYHNMVTTDWYFVTEDGVIRETVLSPSEWGWEYIGDYGDSIEVKLDKPVNFILTNFEISK